ncbi:hypothetical protein Acsp03_12610 [Actinomadura sp. NBRC 104412]|uniref:hypothetical protein n=1 Tax=Actinomadura sp. NBRC 104412 TaxID=3032203 RepID=UPI0024A4BF16|nr:hypothetical protein [Actinomadura sp. NBRC 104412]GLZ03795.1 hypothetical protein Acsp03_12610 [Actinomadura sp. NBRC 104412]
MLGMLRKTGLKSNAMYTMGLASVGASVAAWAMSQNLEQKGVERADRWGIFIGLWAPTLLTVGCAMRLEEQARELGMRIRRGSTSQRAGGRPRETVPVR